MNNRLMEIDIHHTSREDLIRKVRELEKQLDEYNFTNMKLDKGIKELQEQVQDTETALTGAITCINSLKCCGNCDNEDIDYSDNNCMFSGKCKEVMISEVKDKYESYWKPKENL